MFLLVIGLRVRFPRSRRWDGDWGKICLLGINSSERKREGAWWAKGGIKLQGRLEEASASRAGCSGVSITHWNSPLGAGMAQPCTFLLVPTLDAALRRVGVIMDETTVGSWGTAWSCSGWSVDSSLLTTLPMAGHHAPHRERVRAAHLHARHTPCTSPLHPSYLLFVVGLIYCAYASWANAKVLSCSPPCRRHMAEAWCAVALDKYFSNKWIRGYVFLIFFLLRTDKDLFTFQLSYLSWFRVIQILQLYHSKKKKKKWHI